MTLKLELPPEIEARLQAEAAAQGVPIEKLASEKLSALYTSPTESKEQRRIRIQSTLKSAQSYFSQLPPVGNLLAEKRAEVELENAKWEQGAQ